MINKHNANYVLRESQIFRTQNETLLYFTILTMGKWAPCISDCTGSYFQEIQNTCDEIYVGVCF